jgi:hypothetical protein
MVRSYVIIAQLKKNIDKLFILVISLEFDDVLVLHLAMDGNFTLHFLFRTLVLLRLFVDYLTSKSIPTLILYQLVAFTESALH